MIYEEKKTCYWCVDRSNLPVADKIKVHLGNNEMKQGTLRKHEWEFRKNWKAILLSRISGRILHV